MWKDKEVRHLDTHTHIDRGDGGSDEHNWCGSNAMGEMQPKWREMNANCEKNWHSHISKPEWTWTKKERVSLDSIETLMYSWPKRAISIIIIIIIIQRQRHRRQSICNEIKNTHNCFCHEHFCQTTNTRKSAAKNIMFKSNSVPRHCSHVCCGCVRVSANSMNTKKSE